MKQSSAKTSVSAQRQAQNTRTVNLVLSVIDSEGESFLPFDLVCECRDPSCHSKLKVTVAEYKAAQRQPGGRLLEPGHH